MSDKVTKNDIDIFHSHLPEYETLADDFIRTKKLVPPSKGERWKGYFTDGYKEVDPESYIVAHSKADSQPCPLITMKSFLKMKE